MGKAGLDVRHAIIATKDKLPDRFLFADGADKDSGDFLFYIFEVVSGKPDFSGLKKAMITAFSEHTGTASSAEERFEQLLELINTSLNKLIDTGDRSWVGNLNALVGTVSGKKIFLTQTGKIAGYIFRKGKISALTDNGSGSDLHPKQAFSDIISGQLFENDRLIFANTNLFDHLSLDHLRKILEGVSAHEAVHNIYKSLRRMRALSINSVVIEASGENDRNSEEVTPTEMLYLDQVEETALSKAGKFIAPRVQTAGTILSKEARVAGKSIKKNSVILYGKIAEHWNKSLGPKSKQFLRKSNEKVSSIINPGGKSALASLPKISSRQGESKGVKAVYYRHDSTVLTGAIDWTKKAWLAIFSFLQKKESRRYLYLGLILVFLIFGYAKIRYNNLNRDRIKASQDASVAYDQAKEKFDQAKEDKALGRTVDLATYESALDLAIQSSAIPGYKEKAQTLIEDIQVYVDSYTNTTRFYPDKLKRISLGNNIQRIVAVGSDVYAIDTDGKVYLTSPGDQSNRLVASIGKDKGNIINLKFDDSKSKVYILTSSDSVLSLDTKTNTIGEDTATDGWKKSVALATFSGNIYLLSSDEGSIIKYSSSATTFGAGSVYADSKKAAMKGAVDIAIDGNVYVLSSDGNAIKFSRGAKDSQFTLSGIPGNKSTIASPIKLFTSPESSYLYVLDQKENRIVRFDKSGKFSSEYTLNNQTIDDFGINDKIKKGWISSGKTVYEVDL